MYEIIFRTIGGSKRVHVVASVENIGLDVVHRQTQCFRSHQSLALRKGIEGTVNSHKNRKVL